MMKKIELVLKDEPLPQEIEESLSEAVNVLLKNKRYIIPFTKSLTNMPQNVAGNPKFSAELSTYFYNEFERHCYYLGDEYDQGIVRQIVDKLISVFCFYDDFSFRDFLKHNSRYSGTGYNSEEKLQAYAYNRLRGILFERLIGKLIEPLYCASDCKFLCGCCVKIDGIEIRTAHCDIPRRTVDIAGINSGEASGHMLECKIYPLRINEVVVKFMEKLHREMMEAGYELTKTGFVTAGTTAMARMKISESLRSLSLDDPSFEVYDVKRVLESIA